MFQYHLGMTCYYPHMKPKPVAAKTCFMLSALCFFQLQLLFLAAFPLNYSIVKKKKSNFFSF